MYSPLYISTLLVCSRYMLFLVCSSYMLFLVFSSYMLLLVCSHLNTCCYLFVAITCCYLFVVITCCFLFVVVTCCYCTEDTVISGSGDSDVRIWRIPSGECLQVLSAHKAEVVCKWNKSQPCGIISEVYSVLDLKIFDEGFKINSLKKALQVY